jgi:hypothetical protein
MQSHAIYHEDGSVTPVTTVLFLWPSDVQCSVFLLLNAVFSKLCQMAYRLQSP